MAARRAAAARRESSLLIGGFVIVAGLASYALPFLVVQGKKGQNTLEKDGPLSTTEIRRGAFLNSGSKDIGPDPNWDFKTNSYKGRRTPYPRDSDDDSSSQ
ncbi:Aste57867_12736 [Aphanomyces stellatus]|uniref:Aste57867_12736 protein n=1 Tax=Aphanomyces stellatus TaxID=120398 RepID=A0A485KWD2_9STRA|nr:hypothetical protein As57867_012688 [Aphanomyces stellatus]VFT89586.1 Aste57867_12736 [Aphanomyces stellatus]